jgi:PPOX class probable F420-dependent enzyme
MDVPNESRPLPDAVRRFLEPPRHATIATLQPDGSVLQAVVWYGLEDGRSLLINSRNGRRWPANLERDPRIAVAVYDDADPDHWVSIRGTVEVVRSGEPAVADIQALARRYRGNPADFVGQDRITFRVHPQATFHYGDE